MTWYKKAKSDTKFDHYHLIKDRWKDLVREAMGRQNIHFDLENDDSIGKERIISVGEYEDINKETKPCRFLVRACKAGGDWQNPTLYFRVQVYGDSKLPGDLDFIGYGTDKCFVYIPVDGNNNLKEVSDKKGGSKLVPTEDGNGEKYVEIDETSCMKDLRAFLLKLTKMRLKKDAGWEDKIELHFKGGRLV